MTLLQNSAPAPLPMDARACEDRLRELAATIRNTAELTEIKRLLDTTLPLLGFVHYTYVAVDIGAQQNRRIASVSEDATYLTNLDPEWIRHYFEMEYFRADPIVRACSVGRTPIIWNSASFRAGLADDMETMMADAAVNGIVRGISVPVHGFAGELGIFSLYSSEPEETFRPYAQSHELAIQRFAFALHDIVHQRFVSRAAPREVQDIVIRTPGQH